MTTLLAAMPDSSELIAPAPFVASAPPRPLADRRRVAAARRRADEGDLSTVICKAFQILAAFEGPQASMGVSQLSRQTNLPKSTTFRMLRQLMNSGYVTRVGTDYRLSRRVFELASQVPECRGAGLRGVAQPHLCDLFSRVGAVVQLSVLDGADVLYLQKLYGARSPSVPTDVGGRLPAATTAAGKAMLAFSDAAAVHAVVDTGLVRRTPYSIVAPANLAKQLAQIRATGIAYDHEESSMGLTCVAAPLMHRGRPVGAVSISGRPAAFDHDELGRLALRTAQAIAADLSKPPTSFPAATRSWSPVAASC